MLQPIDPELNAFLNLEVPDQLGEAEAADDIAQLFENARLDSAIGKSGTAVALRTEAQDIDARAERMLKHAHAAPANDWNAEIIPESQRLEKRFVAGIHSGRKAARIEKSANGKWVMEFDENNSLIRGYIADED